MAASNLEHLTAERLAVYLICDKLLTINKLSNHTFSHGSWQIPSHTIHDVQNKKTETFIWKWQTFRAIFKRRRSQWPRGLRRRSTAARLLKSWVRIPPGTWMSVCCECCVLSGRGLCDELITRPEESYRLWCVVVCDLETTKILVNEEAKAHWGAIAPKIYIYIYIFI